MIHLLKKRYRDACTLWNLTARTRIEFGLSRRRQLTDIVRLNRFPNRLYFEEYFEFALFRKTPPQTDQFLGKWMELGLDALLNNFSWIVLSQDKLLFHALMEQVNLPAPRILATYQSEHRALVSAPSFHTRDALAQHLRTGMSYPCFGKMIAAGKGQGALLITGYDCNSDTLQLADGTAIALDRCLNEHVSLRQRGYMFQEVLTPDSSMVRVAGPGISGFRIVVLLTTSGPVIFRALWKILAKGNVTDHFYGEHGLTGNLMAWLDATTGRVTDVVQGAGFDARSVEHHPETGCSLLDYQIPRWSEIKELCLMAACEFPTVRFQFWDVALTDKGPVLLELNTGGSFYGAQGGTMRGLYDEEFKQFLNELGHDLARPSTQQLIKRLRSVRESVYRVDDVNRGIGDLYKQFGISKT